MRCSCWIAVLLFYKATAFVLPPSLSKTPSKGQYLSAPHSEVDALKDEIAELKAEAKRRMDALMNQVSETSEEEDDKTQTPVVTMEAVDTSVEAPVDRANDEDDDFRVAVSNEPTQNGASAKVSKDPLDLLDGTRWKIMLNIGREPGTWMPKTWGVSGERLLLNGQVEFMKDQLYDREEFLNGVTNAKYLKVHSFSLGPTMTESLREIKVKDAGGWRVAPGEGPMGTTVLRFYIELEEEVRHQGGDVYCPKGRVYCTCGYFPMNQQQQGIKERLRKEQERLTRQYEEVSAEMENASVWDKIKLGKKLMDFRMEAGKVGQQLNEARVREPERELLRLSRDGNVGLTKEGGVCCKVSKGLAVEYHILGKFGVASVERREFGTS